jgi:hypothetical protein
LEGAAKEGLTQGRCAIEGLFLGIMIITIIMIIIINMLVQVQQIVLHIY